MDMTKLTGPATALAPTGDAAPLLQGSMTGLESCFRDVGEALAAAIDTIDRMASGLEDIRGSLSPDTAGAAVDRLRQVAHRLSTLPTQQRRRAIEVETLTGRTRELRGMLSEIGTILDLLGIYGINIKIASSGETAFFDFVTGMDRKLDSGRREVAHITRELDQFGRVVGVVRQADRLLSEECARTGSSVPAELIDNASALQNHVEAVMRMTDQVAGIVRTVQGEVARILGAIQIGDSVRQRAEHCITILHRIHANDGTIPPRALAHLERLVDAQLRSMADDFQREVNAIVLSLDRLSPLAEELRLLIVSQGSGGDDGQILVRLEQGIAKLDTVTLQLREADGHLASLTTFVGQTLGELASGLSRIKNIAVDVQDISTNTRLLSRRHGENGRAVAVIAKEVAPCATRLDQLGSAISKHIEALTTIDLVQDAGSDSGMVLGDALAIIRHACATSSAAMSRGGNEAENIIASLRASASDLSDQTAFVETLLAVADSLSLHAQTVEPIGDAPADDDRTALLELLPWVARLYTMACERDIHAAFLLPGMTPPPVAAAVSFDDDDDGLF